MNKRFVINSVLVALAYMSGLAMVAVNKTDIPGTIHTLETGWDRAIPLILPFIIPYLFYFIYKLAGIVFVFFRRPDIFPVFALSMITVSLITAAINVVFQTTAPRAVVEGNDLFSVLLRWHYGLNRPLTSFPSLHVADSVCIGFFIHIIEPRRSWPWLVAAFFISISTLFVKLHYIPDVIAGTVLSLSISSLYLYI